MAKSQQDPSLEIFANLRTILVFVILGSTIAALVEYHSQASARKTYEKWRSAIDEKANLDSFITLNEFKGMIAGYPKTSDSKSGGIKNKKEDEDPDSEKDSEKDSEAEESDEEKAQKKRIANTKHAVSKYIDYTWDGLFSTSVVTVQMSDKEGQEETLIYRISDIRH